VFWIYRLIFVRLWVDGNRDYKECNGYKIDSLEVRGCEG
jgi:hypothetical protein